jgi:cbb3-type cytochrome oxidase subunit 3
MKGQLKIQQMSFMILAVTIFFVLVILFFLAVKMQDMKNNASQLKLNEARERVLKLASYAEFSCGVSCVDLDKAMAIKKMEKYQEYFDVGVEIVKLGNSTTECSESNYPNCDIIKLFKQPAGIGEGSFVALCRKDNKNSYGYNKCEVGKIIVYTNEK